MIPCLLFLVNCSKSSKNNNNANCYQQQSGYGGQTYYNPACNNINGGAYPGSTNGYGQICNGIYIYQGQQVQCFSQTRNCAGYTLQTQSGQMVVCQ